jgi:hypothetical protein
MMEYLEVANWDKFQHYKKDNPTWIKLYVNLFRDADWAMLTDAQRGQMVMIWMLASARKGQIPACPKMVKRLCIMDSEPDLNLFISLGFIIGSIKAIEKLYKEPIPETEERREEDKDTRSKSADLHRPRKAVTRFDEFWHVWPKKRLKKDSRKVWKIRSLDDKADMIIADVRKRVKSDKQWREGFVPNPTTYLRGDRWEDEMTDGKTATPRQQSHQMWEPPEWMAKGKDHH